MTRIRFRSTLLPLALLAAGALRAGEGKIPVVAQTTISQPGYYYLTRNIAFTTGVGIYITANDVTLDLNGHTLSAPATAGITGISATDRDRIRVTNGRIVGTYTGVSINLSAPVQEMGVTVDHLEVVNPGFNGIVVQGGGGIPIIPLIEDNRVLGGNGYGLYVNLARAGVVRRNVVRNPITGCVRLNGFNQGRFEDNVLSKCAGNGIYGTSLYNTYIAGNQISECSGDAINLVASSFNVLARNMASPFTGYDGISLNSASNYNTLDGNVAVSTTVGYGLYFSSDSNGNVYSNNRTQGNGSVFGPGNFSAGGNNAGGANF